MFVDGKTIDFLYIATTKDEYELPIAVADGTSELANMLGLKQQTVSAYMCGCNSWRSGFYKVYVGDED